METWRQDTMGPAQILYHTTRNTPAAFHVWASQGHTQQESGLAGAAEPGLPSPPPAKPVHSAPAQGKNMGQIGQGILKSTLVL
ncbi:hypothetical protein E2C01_086641 [Portunus trituberculatus]|uniref:Uncharacterized protein n=1 Tax=Portunus trituberculatus TaxID=210409 RepID=A0A5B7JA96_PORTR|nr:hypothetical protein [Portunus trituberculatus]